MHPRETTLATRLARAGLVLALAALPSCRGDSHAVAFEITDDFSCAAHPEDGTGYLQLICEYIAGNYEAYPIDPNELQIMSVRAGDEQSYFPLSPYADANHAFVELSCCYTGDWAVIEIATSTVVELYLGDL